MTPNHLSSHCYVRICIQSNHWNQGEPHNNNWKEITKMVTRRNMLLPTMAHRSRGEQSTTIKKMSASNDDATTLDVGGPAQFVGLKNG